MKFRLIALALGLLIAGSKAAAVVVDVEATGQWEYYSGPDFDYHLVPYTVRFSYDTTATPTSQSAQQAVYPGLSFSLTVFLDEGTWTHTTNSPHVTMNNGTYTDSLLIASPTNPVGAPAFLGKAVDFFGFDLTAAWPTFSSTSLPTAVNFEDFYFRKAKIYTSNYTESYTSKDSTTLGAPTAVPEPSSWAMFAGAAALGSVFARRLRQRNA